MLPRSAESCFHDALSARAGGKSSMTVGMTWASRSLEMSVLGSLRGYGGFYLLRMSSRECPSEPSICWSLAMALPSCAARKRAPFQNMMKIITDTNAIEFEEENLIVTV